MALLHWWRRIHVQYIVILCNDLSLEYDSNSLPIPIVFQSAHLSAGWAVAYATWLIETCPAAFVHRHEVI